MQPWLPNRTSATLYEAFLKVRLEILDGEGYTKAMASAAASHSRSIKSSATLNEREEALDALRLALFNELDEALMAQAQTSMALYLAP